MSWNVLRKSFCSTKSFQCSNKEKKRKLLSTKFGEDNWTEISQSETSDDYFSESFQYKRNKLNVFRKSSSSRISCSSSEEEGKIDYNPDISNSCVGCSKKTIQPPLDGIYNTKPKVDIRDRCTRQLGEAFLKSLPLKDVFNQKEGVKVSATSVINIDKHCNNAENSKICVSTERPKPTQLPEIGWQKVRSNKTIRGIRSSDGTVDLYTKSECNVKQKKRNCWMALQSNMLIQSAGEGICELESDSESSNFCVGGGLMASRINKISNNRLNASNEIHCELSSLIGEIEKQTSYEKAITAKKRGLLEKFRKALRRAESDYAFWQHEGKIGLREEGNYAQINKMSASYGRIILTLNLNKTELNIILQSNKATKLPSSGSTIEICIENKSYRVGEHVINLFGNKFVKT